jgi:hypothetical protein
VGAAVERGDLQPHVGPLRLLDQVRELRPGEGGRGQRPRQRRLVDHRPEQRRVGPVEHALPAHPQLDPALDLLRVAVHQADHLAGVLRRLQQAGHELALVAADQ